MMIAAPHSTSDIDWKQFLQQHNVSFKHNGSQRLRIDCPWCHDGGNPNMVISLSGEGWKCWANREHRGRQPARLVAALANIPLDEARLMCGQNRLQLGDPRSRVAELLGRNGSPPLPQLSLPDEFLPLSSNPLAKPFLNYLVGRGFRCERALQFTKDYGLRFAVKGLWRYRLVFPVYYHNQLRSWTGRSIVKGAGMRYLALSREHSGVPLTDYLPWFDELYATGGKRLVLCEGPFDALKLRELGQPATCFFTATPSPGQIDKLRALLPRWKQRLLLLDRGTTAAALAIQREWRAALGLQVRQLPAGIKDPGELQSIDFLTVTAA